MTVQRNGRSLSIHIAGLSNGVHTYHLTAESADVGLPELFRKPVSVDVELDKTARQILLKAKIRCAGSFECDRCLEQFEREITAGYSMVYLYHEPEGKQYPPEEVQVITPETSLIDLTEDVRQMILLSVPLKLLCREDCRGLCPHCGSNLNRVQCTCRPAADTSPWGKLEQLRNR